MAHFEPSSRYGSASVGSEAARGDLLTDQFEWRRGVWTPLRACGTCAPRSFVYDGGSKKTLTIYWALPNRLSFFLCPQTPGDQYERSGFILAEPSSGGGMGGAASVNKEPQAPCFQASGTHHHKQNSRGAHVFMRGAAWNSPRALSLRSPTNHRVRFHSDPPQITACAFTPIPRKSPRAFAIWRRRKSPRAFAKRAARSSKKPMARRRTRAAMA